MHIETKTVYDKLEDFIKRPLTEDASEINAYHRVRAFIELLVNQQIEEMGLAWEAGHVDSMRLVNEKTGYLIDDSDDRSSIARKEKLAKQAKVLNESLASLDLKIKVY